MRVGLRHSPSTTTLTRKSNLPRLLVPELEQTCRPNERPRHESPRLDSSTVCYRKSADRAPKEGLGRWMGMDGGAEGDRTLDLRIAKALHPARSLGLRRGCSDAPHRTTTQSVFLTLDERCITVGNTEDAMTTRTVRFDDDTEKALDEVRAATGWPISEVLKRGVKALRARVRNRPARLPFDVYKELDLGPGGYAITSSSNTRAGVRMALKRKHGR
jgi:hypothetical protein